MKNLGLILLIFFVCFVNEGFSQSQTDTIEIYRSLGSPYWHKGKNLTPKQVLNLMKSNPEAYGEMKYAKNNFDFANILGFTGGFFIGYPVGAYFGGGKPNWAFAVFGAGLGLISIPFTLEYNKHAKRAVNIYNTSLKQHSKSPFNISEIKFGFNANSFGMKINF